MSTPKRCSSDSSGNLDTSPSKQIKLSQQITRHPGKFVGSGTSLADIESCLANQMQTPKRARATPAKRLSKFSPVRFVKVPVSRKNVSGNNVPGNRHSVTKKLFFEPDDDGYDDGSVLDPVLEEEFVKDLSFRVRNFSNLLVDVLGDSSTFHLIDQTELSTVSNFLNMPPHCKELYIQMYNRKHKWHQVSDIKYAPNISDMFNEIESYGFITSDIMSEDLDTLLDFLKVSDLKSLCKELKLKLGGGKKPDMKAMLLDYARKQKTLANTDSSSVIKMKISKMIGHCIKLCHDAWKLFHRIDLLFSLPFAGEDNVENLVHHNLLHINYVESGKMVYPTYNVIKTIPIFATKESLIKYEEAIQLENALAAMLSKKVCEVAKTYISQVWDNFRNIILDEVQNDDVLKLSSYLRCYTAGSVYARTLFAGVVGLRNDDDFYKDAIQILKELLKQKVYNPQSRGFWYDQLVSLLRIKRPLDAARTVVEAMKDPDLDEIQRCVLSNRGSRLLARKKPLPKQIRQLLHDCIEEPLEEPAFNIIEAKSLRSNRQGFKLIYIQEDDHEGTTYSSVEELVISHYKKIGFSKGMHAENIIIVSIFGLIFWDIIYEHSVPNVFQSQYQSQPLDLKSREFYSNRKDVIDARLTEMEKWFLKDIRALVKQRYSEHEGKLSIVNWGRFSCVEHAIELISCIGTHLLSLLCERMAKSYHTACSGFPDLVLWTPGQWDRCKFVEVKGQGDTLSPNQKLWMDFLINIGADAEVCNVRRTGHKVTRKNAVKGNARRKAR